MFSPVAFAKALLATEVPTTHPLKSLGVSSRYVKPAIEAIVTQTIVPGRKGQVKWQGSWWTARCCQDITLSPGKLVQVVDRQTITLYVEPVFLTPQGH